jgi:hypothetical protein
MRYSYSFDGLVKRKYKIGANVVLGQPVIWLDAALGMTDPASATDLTDAVGVTTEAGTYSTTQGTGASSANVEVEIIINPLAIFRAKVVPSATADTDFAANDGYYLTNDTADSTGLTVADGDTGGTSSDAINGYMFSIDGANVGQSRVISAHSASTSVVVTVPFDYTIAAGDNFVFSQYGPGVRSVDMTTDFLQLNGAAAGGTDNAEAVVVDVMVSTTKDGYSVSTPLMEADIIFDYHVFNSLAVA